MYRFCLFLFLCCRPHVPKERYLSAGYDSAGGHCVVRHACKLMNTFDTTCTRAHVVSLHGLAMHALIIASTVLADALLVCVVPAKESIWSAWS